MMGSKAAVALLRALLPEAQREYVVGDLLEEYERYVLSERGRLRAALWLWRQVLLSIPGALSLRLRSRTRRTPGDRARGDSMVRDLWQDFKYGARVLRRTPLLALVAIATLVLGVGVNTAIFAVVYGVLLRPLPFEVPERLVAVWEKNPERNWMFNLSAPANALDWRERVKSFEDLTVHGMAGSVSLSGAGDPEMLSGVQVLGNFFSVLGVSPFLGRGFEMEDTWAGEGEGVVVLSYGFWQRRYGSDSGVLGSRIVLDGEPATVVGVMPEGFEFPQPGIDVWAPVGWDPAFRAEIWFRRAHFLWSIARLRHGVSFEEAQAELEAVALQLEAEYPETNRSMGAGLTPLHEWIVGGTRRPLLVLFAAVGLVLLIACANVGSLLLARASTRTQEMAVRGALGAGRARLARQLLAESLLLASAGGALAMLLAKLSLPVLLALVPAGIPRLHEVGFGEEVLLFSVGVSIATALGFGLAPAFRAGRYGMSLREAGARGHSRPRTRAGQLLVVSEVALAVILTAGAGLLIRSFLRLSAAPTGFDPDGRWTVSVSLPGSKYPEESDCLRFHESVLERLSSSPAVAAVAAADQLPLTGLHWTTDFLFEGRSPEELGVEFHRRRVSPGYFRVMGVPLLAGRDFADSDRSDTEPVVIVNESVARLYFPGEEAVGRRIAFQNEEPRRWRRIVGVVGDEKLEGMHVQTRPEIFLPIAQNPPSTVRYVFRLPFDPEGALDVIRSEIAAADPELPVFRVSSLEEVVSSSLARERFLSTLLGGFASLALLLAAVGIYGVVAYGVSRRQYEIGIRLALGAKAGEVVRLIARQSFLPGAIGIGLGILGALSLSGVLAGLLFEVGGNDATTLALTALLMAAVAWLASYLPARRASRVSPIASLRSE